MLFRSSLQGDLAPDGLTHEFASAPARPLAQPVEHALKVLIKANRQSALHVLQCNTKTRGDTLANIRLQPTAASELCAAAAEPAR